MEEETLSRSQVEKGVVLLVVFVVLRAVIMAIPGFGQELEANLQSLLFLLVAFLIGSVGIVYLGFAKWVGIDLGRWWQFSRKRIAGDVGWGVLGFFVGFILMVTVLLPFAFLAWAMGLPLSPSVTVSPIGFLLNLVFGFAIAGFQEETIFRGFLQSVLMERFGRWQANGVQAVVFSLAHIGYYPLTEWPLFISAFVSGLVFGWLRVKRGTLVAPWIAHGLIG